jgi:hypothetical protein
MMGRILFGHRTDGERVRDLAPTRAILPYLFRTRAESAVYFELLVDAKNIAPFLDAERARTGRKVTLLHLVLLATARILERRPRLNSFTVNVRIYQRHGIWLSFSAKTEKNDSGAVVALKRRIDPAWDLARVFDETTQVVGDSRSGKKSQSDKELALALALPSFMTKWAISLLLWADRHGLLPKQIVDGDPLFASMFVANLGSIGMDAPFHHLYEYGNIPLFCAIGRERTELALDANGAVVKKQVVPFRFTFDERVEDGLYCLGALEMLRAMLEDPATAFRVGA